MFADWQVMIAAADIANRRKIALTLERWGLDPICSSTIEKARQILASRTISLVFCENHLPDGNFRDLLEAVKQAKSNVRVVVMLQPEEDTQADTFQEALRLGAFHVIRFPCEPTDVEWMLVYAIRQARETGELLQ